MIYQTESGAWLDLQLSSDHPVSAERLLERRQMIYDIHAQMFASDLVVITPGLTEAWFDAQSGLYIQDMPSRAMAKTQPDRFFLEVLDFHQCHETLDQSVQILRDAGTKQIALTVSPVPLARTMTAKDVLIANTYSKSTLRSVAGLLSDQYDLVHYVPSYERVMLTKRTDVWNDDLRHITDQFVGGIVSTFAAAAGQESKDSTSLFLDFNTACKSEDFAKAASLFAEIERDLKESGGSFERLPTFEFHKNACVLMMKTGRDDEALRFATILRTIRSHKAIGYIREINLRMKRREKDKAKEIAISGLKSCDEISLKWLRKTIDKKFDPKTRKQIAAKVD